MNDEMTGTMAKVADSESKPNEKIDRLREVTARRKKGGQKKSHKEDAEIKKLLVELFTSGESGSELFSILEDTPLEVAAEASRDAWSGLGAESRRKFIEGLLRGSSDRASSRQVAIAGKLVSIDGQSSAEILHGVISRGLKGDTFWPKLSNEKIAHLKNHFFLGRRDWVPCDCPNSEVIKTLLAAFLHVAFLVASDTKGTNRAPGFRFWCNFAKWALTALDRIKLDSADRRSALERLRALGVSVPSGWPPEIASLLNEGDNSLIQQTTIMPPAEEIQPQNVLEEPSLERDVEGSADFDLPPEARLGATVPHPAPVELATDLDLIAKVESFIQKQEAEIGLVKSLVDSLRHSLKREATMKEEIERMHNQAEALESANASYHTQLTRSESARREAEERNVRLEERAQQLKEELTKARSELEETIRRIDREVPVRLDDFKGKLRVKLRPIFENKKSTDSEPPDAALAELLRQWFKEIEDELERQGISLL